MKFTYKNVLSTIVLMGVVYLNEAHILQHTGLKRFVKRHAPEHEEWTGDQQHEEWNGDQHHKEKEMCFTIPHLQALKQQFAGYLDKNGDEKASEEEIMEYLQKYNPSTTKEQVENFIERRDMDQDGSVDFIPDYLLEVSEPDYDLKTAREWFELEDSNNDGVVSAEELMNIALKVGMSEHEAEQTVLGYYMSADRNDDGKLTWEEYKPLFLV